uniref:Uncharacterized protein n=1 Tax=Hucho hucho TaxID=62062 RepID=A0A4W5RXP0_9TELE
MSLLQGKDLTNPWMSLPQGKDLTRAMTRGEVVARLGDQECEVKTLDSTHLYCEPPEKQPASLGNNKLPSLRVSLLYLYTLP